MQDEEIKKLRVLCEKATPGPWYTVEQPWLERDLPTWVIAGSNDPSGAIPICDSLDDFRYEGFDAEQSDWDMTFIAASREAMPKLLDKIESQKKTITQQVQIALKALDATIAVTKELVLYKKALELTLNHFYDRGFTTGRSSDWLDQARKELEKKE